MTRARAFARVAIDGLLQRKGRFDGIGPFEDAHIRIDPTISPSTASTSRQARSRSRW